MPIAVPNDDTHTDRMTARAKKLLELTARVAYYASAQTGLT